MTAVHVQFVTPLPPLPTGIAQYSRDLLRALDDRWPLDVVPEAGSDPTILRSFRAGVPTVFQIGNSGFHRLAYKHALREPGVLVLHDVSLHHGRAGELLRSGGSGYLKIMRERYGDDGARAVRDILAGRQVDDIGAFPLSEDYIERAKVTVVHSQYARRLVQRFVPEADVVVVPMGVPLPALVEQAAARRALGLPASAFVVASITHVNPYKRIPVVLRAMRRLIVHEPDAILVIAGSVAPGIDLKRQIALLNLDRNVRMLGYVSDDQARLVARAADVCINLRYPSAGETSASLLRLLGAGRPVLVTDDEPMAEFPRDAVLPVPVDRFEDEMVSELLLLLARDETLREEAGAAARAFIAGEHSLAVMVDGYRAAIHRAFGIEMPSIALMTVDEEAPNLDVSETVPTTVSWLETRVVDGIAGLRLAGHDATIVVAARAMTQLGLNRLPAQQNGRTDDEPVAPDS
ncbi:MAG TPA: glycosyltransferase family 4 protein [Thermomicrobiales bacterium]|nr:glycosyltransferase family 4 protein [Thermomicrobiales bacterium]